MGATGYSGVELVRILLDHPKVELADLVSRSYVGQEFAQVFPAFRGKLAKMFSSMPTRLALDCKEPGSPPGNFAKIKSPLV